MAEILITNIEIPEGKKGLTLAVNRHGEVFVFYGDKSSGCVAPLKRRESKAVFLSTHGRLVDIDKMIAESKETYSPVAITSTEDLADFLEEYADLDKTDHTVIVPASEETDKDCQSCYWCQQRGCQFQCVHEHGECNGERFEQAEP